MNYNACDLLLSLEGASLEVTTGLGNDLMVCYAGAKVKVADVYLPLRGEGRDFGDACADYLDRIRGKLVKFADGKEMHVLG